MNFIFTNLKKENMKTIKINVIGILLFTILGIFESNAQIPQVEEGKALVVFYRQKKFSGGAVKFSVKESDKTFGQLTNGSVVNARVEPGERTFWSQVISSDAIVLTVEEGKVYYVKATVRTGALAGRPKFSQVDEITAQKDMKKIK